MALKKNTAPSPTDLIDWMNAEGVLDLDWDFPEEGDLVEAGLDANAISHLVTAVEDEYGVELTPEDLTPANLTNPTTLAKLIGRKIS